MLKKHLRFKITPQQIEDLCAVKPDAAEGLLDQIKAKLADRRAGRLPAAAERKGRAAPLEASPARRVVEKSPPVREPKPPPAKKAPRPAKSRSPDPPPPPAAKKEKRRAAGRDEENHQGAGGRAGGVGAPAAHAAQVRDVARR